MIDREAILEAYRFRHACKKFDAERRIPAEDFEFILETGRLSPSSFGLEPWKFLVIQNMDLRRKLLVTTWGGQGQLPTASHYLAILYRLSDMEPDSGYVQHIMRDVQKVADEVRVAKLGRYRRFLETDHHLLDAADGLADWAGKQCYIALGNMMTAAAMIGVDSCPIEGFDMDATESLLADAGLLDREQFGLAVMVAFGYRINPQPAKTRQAMSDVVQWVE